LPSRGGRPGLLVSGTRTLFDDVSVRSLSSPAVAPSEREIPAIFTNDEYMRQWTLALPAADGWQTHDMWFQEQPVDWMPLQGRWQNSSRWSCQPKWPFYRAPPPQEQVLVCYKRPLCGDFTIDLFASPPRALRDRQHCHLRRQGVMEARRHATCFSSSTRTPPAVAKPSRPGPAPGT